MTAPQTPDGYEPAPFSETRLWPAVVGALAIGTVLCVAATVFIVSRMDPAVDDTSGDQASSTTVQLEAVGSRSTAPFAESTVTADESELGAFAQSDQVTAAISAEPCDDRVVSGDSSLLYGSRPSRPVCDVARLAELVTNDPTVTSS